MQTSPIATAAKLRFVKRTRHPFHSLYRHDVTYLRVEGNLEWNTGGMSCSSHRHQRQTKCRTKRYIYPHYHTHAQCEGSRLWYATKTIIIILNFVCIREFFKPQSFGISFLFPRSSVRRKPRRVGARLLRFSIAYTTVQGPTQPPIQRVLGGCLPEGKATVSWIVPPLPHTSLCCGT